MLDLIKFFQILFTSPKISRERLKLFAEDHLARLTANNPGGIFGTILASLTAAYTAFAGNLADKSTLEAVLKGLTTTMEEKKAAVLKFIQDAENLIAYTYRNNTAFYEEFYPQGLTEYDNADLPSFETITQRFKNALAAHAGDFAAAFVLEYNTAHTAFTTARSNQLTGKGNLSGEGEQVGDTKLALAKQLTINVLTISLQYSGQEDKAAVYFDQSILDAAFANNSKAEGDLDARETANCFSNTKKPDTQYRIKLNSEGVVRIAFKATEDEAVAVTEGREILSGQDWQLFTAADLGYSSELKFLNITNTGEVTTSFIIERV